MLGGNSQKDAKAEVSWDYEKNAIIIEMVSDTELNFYANEPHTVVLGIYQLADEKSFAKMLTNEPQLIAGLSSGKGGEGVIQMDRYVINPGRRTTITLDRVQDCRFVGMVAGYYQMNALKSARLFRVPLNIKTEGIVTTTYVATPAVLATRLYLGSDQIVNAQMLTYDADKKKVIEVVPLDSKNPEIKLTPEELKMAEQSSQAAMKLQME
jgi:predicted component of type VI protein secretion system